MRVLRKIGWGLLGLVTLAVVVLAVLLRYESECGPPPELAAGTPQMNAIHYRCYGSPDVLRLEATEKPVPGEGQVLVRVRAAGVNPLDWHYLRGTPYLVRLFTGIGKPKNSRLGVDFAGTVESVGAGVTRYQPGDAVFGGATGAFGEYVLVRESGALAPKPDSVSFEQAGGVAIAGITALQGLRDKGGLAAGQRVLINGASGGVGTFAVQIAKSFDAEVTGVCSTRNVELVRSLGADHVIDYTKEDFVERARRDGKRYDVILDMVANHGLLDLRHALEPDGVLVQVGAAEIGNWIDPLLGPLKSLALSPFLKPEVTGILARLKADDMAALAELMRTGQVTPVIDRQYPLAETAEAIRYSEEGHARGKIVVTVD